MSRLTLLILFLVIVTGTFPQSLCVNSFKLLDSDLTANTAGTLEQDQNGETAALIKVVTTQTGFSFDGGALGIVKTKQTPGEIWVYVPRGSKKITIKHPQLGVLRDYYYPMAIEAAKTYELVLTTGTVQTIVQQTSNSQYLVLKVSPADATVELDNMILPNTGGVVEKFVKFGTYEYRVQAPNYHTTAGQVTIDDPNNKKVIEINLQPAFGWIEVSGNSEIDGAQVYIDNALVGTVPMRSQNILSGQHVVNVVKDLYQPFSELVEVKDGQTTKINPQLVGDFSTVTLNVTNGADIYVNGEKKGIGSWTGELGTGTYLLEAKKEGHRTTQMNVDISSNQPTRTVNLDAPIPIYGSLNITSTPSMVDVLIDEELCGQTPLYLPHVLIGQHSIALKAKGYDDYRSTIEVREDKDDLINVELVNTVMVTFRVNVSSAEIFIDGKLIGKGKAKEKVTIGEHVIEVKTTKKYGNYKKVHIFTASSSKMDINLEKKESVLAKFSVNSSVAAIYVDDEFVGKGRGERMVSIGEHSIKVESREKYYSDYAGMVNIDKTNNDIFIKLESIIVNTTFVFEQPVPGNIIFSVDGKPSLYDDRNPSITKSLDIGKHEVVIRINDEKIRHTIDVDRQHNYFIISLSNGTISTL